MKILIILNDPPYGTERSYNGLRLAHSLKKNVPAATITIFLMGDAVLCAKAGQKTPEGFYNIEKMVRRVIDGGGRAILCGTCMDARGIAEAELTDGATRGTMDELSAATLEADKVMVF